MTLRNAEEARRHAEAWCAYLYGDLSPEEEVEREREFLEDEEACAELYREWNLDACLETLGAVAAAPAPAKKKRPTPWKKVSIAVGLALSVAGLGWWAGLSGLPSLPTDSPRCRPLDPKGAQLAFPTVFRWSREGGARSYHFELRDPGGSVHYEATVVDTLLVLPRSKAEVRRSGGSWSWKVEPEGGGGRSGRSTEVARFEVGG